MKTRVRSPQGNKVFRENIAMLSCTYNLLNMQCLCVEKEKKGTGQKQFLEINFLEKIYLGKLILADEELHDVGHEPGVDFMNQF
jgi:hypothetical protein